MNRCTENANIVFQSITLEKQLMKRQMPDWRSIILRGCDYRSRLLWEYRDRRCYSWWQTGSQQAYTGCCCCCGCTASARRWQDFQPSMYSLRVNDEQRISASAHRWPSPLCSEGLASYFRVRGDARWAEARGPKGVGFLGIGQSASSPPARGLGEHCKLPQRGLGLSPAAKRFSCILEAPDSLSWNLFGPSSGEAAPLSFLKSVFASAPDRTTCKSTAL